MTTTPPSVDPAPAADPATPPADPATAPATAAIPTDHAPTSAVEVTPEIQALIDEAARKASKDANREAIKAKQRAKELEDAEEARKLAELSEIEQAKTKAEAAEARAAKLEADARTARIEAALEKAARAAGYADEGDALQLATQIEVDADGRPVGVTEAVTALLASKPHYAAATNPSLDPTNGGRGSKAPALTPQQQTAELWNSSRGSSIWTIPPAS